MPLTTLRSRGHRVLIEVLVEMRKEAGLTQRGLAERLRRPKSYVSKIEVGERDINPVECVDWARGCGATPLALFRRFTRRLEGRR